MNERLLQFVSIGLTVFLVGAVWAGPENDDYEHRGMHRGHAGMMHGGPNFDRMVEHMSRLLELDDAQEQAIRNIVDDARPKAKALHERAKANREAMHALNVSDTDYDVKLQNVAAENGDTDANDETLAMLRAEMRLPLGDAKAQQKCIQCHDLDNSPDFHKKGKFEEYWEKVKHEGKD